MMRATLPTLAAIALLSTTSSAIPSQSFSRDVHCTVDAMMYSTILKAIASKQDRTPFTYKTEMNRADSAKNSMLLRTLLGKSEADMHEAAGSIKNLLNKSTKAFMATIEEKGPESLPGLAIIAKSKFEICVVEFSL